MYDNRIGLPSTSSDAYTTRGRKHLERGGGESTQLVPVNAWHITTKRSRAHMNLFASATSVIAGVLLTNRAAAYRQLGQHHNNYSALLWNYAAANDR